MKLTWLAWVPLLVVLATALPSVARAEGKPVALATEDDEKAARDAFVAAKAHYDAKRWEQALDGFRASYDIVKSPNSHLMIGRVLTELDRPATAYDELTVTIWEAEQASQLGRAYADKYRRTLTTARSLVADLRSKIGLVRITIEGSEDVPPGSTLTVNGRSVASVAGEIAVRGGVVNVELSTPDGVKTATGDVKAGGKTSIVIARPASPSTPTPVEPGEPAPQPTPDDNPYLVPAWVAAGVGVAGFVVFGVFGALTASTFDDLEAQCPGARCDPNKESDIDDGRAYQVTANVGLTVGALGAAVAVTLFVLGATDGEEAAWLVPTTDGIAVGGRF